MNAVGLDEGGPLVVISEYSTAVAIAPQGLGGEEGGGGDVAETAGTAHHKAVAVGLGQLDASAKALGTVLDEVHAFAFGDGADGGEVGGQAEEVHGNHRFGTQGHVVVYRADGIVQTFGIHVEGAGVDIDKDGSGAFERHHFGRGEEGEVGHKDCIAFAHAKGLQGQGQGVGAVGTG